MDLGDNQLYNDEENMAENYRDMAKSDAWETCYEFLDEMIEQAIDGKISNDLLNDYADGDSYHHESHVDKDYDLMESAEILRQLRNCEETDSGLWEGLEPKRAIAAQAAYTYGNAVYHEWYEIVDNMNDKIDMHYESDRLKKLYITVRVRLHATTPDERLNNGAEVGLVAALLDGAEKGDLSGVPIYCDWLEEFGQRERLMLELRQTWNDKKLTLHIGHDLDTENPCNYGGWKIVSFGRKHGNYEHPDNYISSVDVHGDITPTINVLSKLCHDLAFWLSYYEHGQCRWSLKGEGPQCQWDATRIAGIMIWQDKAKDLPKAKREESARNFLETYTQWCNGECYHFSIEDDEGESIDSCSGFIGAEYMFETIRGLTQNMGDIEVTGDCADLAQHYDVQ